MHYDIKKKYFMAFYCKSGNLLSILSVLYFFQDIFQQRPSISQAERIARLMFLECLAMMAVDREEIVPVSGRTAFKSVSVIRVSGFC